MYVLKASLHNACHVIWKSP